ncbi:MAG: pirin [Alphaproteobacteria bacterium]|nr:pirin [Alphaproteobacteria bacterium]
MGEIHELVRRHGHRQAELFAPDALKGCAKIAHQVMADESEAAGFSYSGFAITALPYRRLRDDETWVRKIGNVTLAIDPGSLQVAGQVRRFGVPYGASARLVLLYLQSEAVRRQTPRIELGSSLNDFVVNRLRLANGGKTATQLLDQLQRMAACSLKFFWEIGNGEGDGFESATIIKSGQFSRASAGDGRQAALWEDEVSLDPSFYQHLIHHAVPLREEAIRALADEPVALDAYIWLCYRLRVLEKPTPISWAALHAQFGPGYKLVRQFKPKFAASLRRALAAYEEAKVTITDGGLVLYPSEAPVRRVR